MKLKDSNPILPLRPPRRHLRLPVPPPAAGRSPPGDRALPSFCDPILSFNTINVSHHTLPPLQASNMHCVLHQRRKKRMSETHFPVPNPYREHIWALILGMDYLWMS
ncbi:hypothetical protein EYF80_034968 [Liparis tanakae]|uniref:Uncharacterized protein n=1 Tax=Liparis tanakae TaxID=230148 RepID=A0A4Z2GND5_9TELE|nr:hypothetical protein EYF80_034968 [Liparis tanakae]